MNLYLRNLKGHLAKDSNWKRGYLIYGADEATVSQIKDTIINAVVGPNAAKDFRLDKLGGDDLVGNSSHLKSLVEAQSFFGGRRAVLVQKATPQNAKAIFAALDDWKPGYAHVVITASPINKSTELRKKFENSNDLASIGVYVEHPTSKELRSLLEEANLKSIAPGALEYLEHVSGEQEPTMIRAWIKKLALYKLDDASELSIEDIQDCFPENGDRGIEELIETVADRNQAQVSPFLRKLSATELNPVMICIRTKLKLRAILTVISHNDGLDAGLRTLRPPVFGKRRDRLKKQVSKWNISSAKKAMQILAETDRKIRRPGFKRPEALVERTLINITVTK